MILKEALEKLEQDEEPVPIQEEVDMSRYVRVRARLCIDDVGRDDFYVSMIVAAFTAEAMVFTATVVATAAVCGSIDGQ